MLDEPRPVYVSSGRFVISDVLVGACCLSGVALLMASILAWLTANEFFAVGLTWFFPAVIVYWRVRRTVGSTKTRNRLVGFALGFFTGTVLVLGLYHIDQCSRWGVGWHRLDRLPGYITFRMETDIWVFPGRGAFINPAPAQAGIVPWHQPRVTLSRQWVAFFGEVGLIMFIPGIIGLRRTRRPFSELLNDWFSGESLVLTPQSADGLRSALKTGALEEWVTIGIERTGSQEKCTEVTIWYCLRSAKSDASESSVYVSLGEGPCLLLDPEEAALVSNIVPGLAEFAIPIESIYDDPAKSLSDPTVAQLIKIPGPGPHVGQTKKPYVIWTGRIKMIGMFYLVPFGIIAALTLFAGYSEQLGVPRWAVIVVVGAAVIAFLVMLGWWTNDVGGNPTWRMICRHYRGVMTAEIALRTDAILSLSDRRLIHADIIPRRNWSDLFNMRDGNDGGFLLLDVDRQLLLYEGDTYRFIIPAASIIRCQVEDVTKTQTTAGFYATVITARTKTGSHDFPFLPLDGIWGANRFEKAVVLQGRILSEFETAIPENEQDAAKMIGFEAKDPKAPIVF